METLGVAFYVESDLENTAKYENKKTQFFSPLVDLHKVHIL
jgi:hypothetical protein